ncbi:MAG: hypothetical protein H0V67_10555 [Geodermatophilaceae bacterium]|nr:hypothetical protein [Geodermatophilaceae bacterium]
MRALVPLAVVLVVASLVLLLLGVREVNDGLIWGAVVTSAAAGALMVLLRLRGNSGRS